MAEDHIVSGRAVLVAALRYYVSHPGVLVYLIPNLGLLAWLVVSPQWTRFAWCAAGFLAFLPQEHLTHAYILHFKPPRNMTAYRFMYRAHYGHHEFPRRIDLMWIPLWLTVPLLVLNVAVASPFAGGVANTLAFLSGLFTGYLLFEWFHLLCHVPLRLTSRALSAMRTRHLWHHYRNEDHWFAVQHAAWLCDTVANTAGAPATVPRSATSFSLGVDMEDPRIALARRFFAARSTGDLERSGIWL